MAAIKIVLLGLSWLQAGTLAPHVKPRPKPVEPDVISNGNNDFRAPTPKQADYYVPIFKEPNWPRDEKGFYWVRQTDGSYAGEKTMIEALRWGTPVKGPYLGAID